MCHCSSLEDLLVLSTESTRCFELMNCSKIHNRLGKNKPRLNSYYRRLFRTQSTEESSVQYRSGTEESSVRTEDSCVRNMEYFSARQEIVCRTYEDPSVLRTYGEVFRTADGRVWGTLYGRLLREYSFVHAQESSFRTEVPTQT